MFKKSQLAQSRSKKVFFLQLHLNMNSCETQPLFSHFKFKQIKSHRNLQHAPHVKETKITTVFKFRFKLEATVKLARLTLASVSKLNLQLSSSAFHCIFRVCTAESELVYKKILSEQRKQFLIQFCL